MDTVVESVVSRNTWAIMKEFKVLPTDPRFKSLTIAQREWIIRNMILDTQELKNAQEGKESTKGYRDTSKDFDKFFEKRGEYRHAVDIDDDSLSGDEIYEQVKDMTEDSTYDENLEAKIRNAIADKELEEENIKRQQADSMNKLQQKYGNKIKF